MLWPTDRCSGGWAEPVDVFQHRCPAATSPRTGVGIAGPDDHRPFGGTVTPRTWHGAAGSIAASRGALALTEEGDAVARPCLLRLLEGVDHLGHELRIITVRRVPEPLSDRP